MEDYYLLANYTAKGPGSEDLHWEPTPKQLAVMKVDERHSAIDVYDATKLYKFLQGDPSIPSLGVSYYTYSSSELGELDNVSNLLIVEGHYDKSTNIPFLDFVNNDWVIHEKFFNYLLGMAIHKYSNSEDITYMQKLLQEYLPEYKYQDEFFQVGHYNNNMKQTVMSFQKSLVSYYRGDLNRDNKITNEDLIMLRNYLDDSKNYYTVQGYLNKEIELTEAEIAALDVTSDGELTKEDLEIYRKQLFDKYSGGGTGTAAQNKFTNFINRADVNNDGKINEDDYRLLKREIETNMKVN